MKDEYERIYQMGKRHGKEEMAFEIYRDYALNEEDNDD
jgi:hypothetical protein